MAVQERETIGSIGSDKVGGLRSSERKKRRSVRSSVS